MSWKPLNTSEVIKRRQAQIETTSASVGGFAVPLGSGPLKPIKPYEPLKIKKTP